MESWGKRRGRGKWVEMTQTLYVHMNKIKIKKKKTTNLASLPPLPWVFALSSHIHEQTTIAFLW
jgi:hypothetical protein